MTIPAGTSTTATLQVIDDRIDEGTETVEVQASADGYGPSDAVAVPIGDDDSAGLTVTPADLSLTEGGSGQYEVRLDSQPLHPVTITIASSNPDVEAPTPLSFTADNWNQFQAVTVTVAHDDDATDESATVTHTAESGDLNYQGIPVPSVSVSVSDDDNQPPRCDSIATQILRVADSQTVDLSEYCSDPDGHSLDYTASSSDTSKVTVSMTGSRLTLTGVAATASPHPRVTVTVTDGHGGSDSVEFPVTVREKPSCDLSSISDQTLFEDEERMLPLSSVCDVTYSASSSPSGIVTVSVNNSTDELTIRGQSVGTATVTVTVTGSGCESDSVSFQVTVEERPPSPEAFISASSVIVDADGCTTLNWETENAASASISPGVGVAVKLNKEQSHRVCPDAKQQYTLTAIGEPGAIPPRDTAERDRAAAVSDGFPHRRSDNHLPGRANDAELDDDQRGKRLDQRGGNCKFRSSLRVEAGPAEFLASLYPVGFGTDGSRPLNRHGRRIREGGPAAGFSDDRFLRGQPDNHHGWRLHDAELDDDRCGKREHQSGDWRRAFVRGWKRSGLPEFGRDLQADGDGGGRSTTSNSHGQRDRDGQPPCAVVAGDNLDQPIAATAGRPGDDLRESLRRHSRVGVVRGAFGKHLQRPRLQLVEHFDRSTHSGFFKRRTSVGHRDDAWRKYQ